MFDTDLGSVEHTHTVTNTRTQTQTQRTNLGTGPICGHIPKFPAGLVPVTLALGVQTRLNLSCPLTLCKECTFGDISV
jgi:hypothetical protein